MSSTATVTASGALPGLPMRVSRRSLIYILGLIPAFAAAALLDRFWLGGVIREWMLTDPREIALWAAVLTLPHIVASLVTFADPDYLSLYRDRLKKGALVALALGFGVPTVSGLLGFGSIGILVVMAFYTMYHNLMQQYGLSLMMCRQPPTLDYHLWRWFTIVPAGVAYTALMSSNYESVITHWDKIVLAIGVFLAFATIFGVRLVMTVLRNPNRTTAGMVYLLGNMSMLYVCFALIATGYGFMATLLPRLTHDLTAFWVYMVHDQNRNAGISHNPVYRLPKKIGIPPALLCVPLALALSYGLLQLAHSMYWVVMFVTALNFMHYYMETFMWHRGTPHRRYVPFE